MEMEQMMAHLLAEIRTNQDKAAANLKKIKDEMMARLEAKINAHHERMMASLDSHL
jgi:hypothetical protein